MRGPLLAAIALLLSAVASSAVVYGAIRAQKPARAMPVAVFPIPGSQVVEPGAQIVFRGVRVDRIRKITVLGSKSGLHTGKIEADSDGHGGSFIPAKPFVPGETVKVHLPILDARHGTWQFKIADEAGLIPIRQRYVGSRVPNDVWQFRSRSDLQPAAVQVHKTGGGSDDIFVAAQYGPVQNGPS